jgi:hypothetical protein
MTPPTCLDAPRAYAAPRWPAGPAGAKSRRYLGATVTLVSVRAGQDESGRHG